MDIRMHNRYILRVRLRCGINVSVSCCVRLFERHLSVGPDSCPERDLWGHGWGWVAERLFVVTCMKAASKDGFDE